MRKRFDKNPSWTLESTGKPPTTANLQHPSPHELGAGIPVGSPLNGFDAISVQTMKDFAAQGERIVPSSAVVTSAVFQESVNPALQAFVDPSNAAYKNVSTVLQTLRQNYASIVP